MVSPTELIVAAHFSRIYGMSVQPQNIDTQLPVIRDLYHALTAAINDLITSQVEAATGPVVDENARLKSLILTLYKEVMDE